jgi:hypothetical protein
VTIDGRFTAAKTADAYRHGMNANSPATERLNDMPLWRLLVLLADLEREVGPSTPTARVVTRLINERLRGEKPVPATERGPRHAS